MADDYFKRSNWKRKDEYYTPPILVDAIIPYVERGIGPICDTTVWCPFDTENSEFVLRLKEAGYKVLYSHIWTGQDFFDYEPEEHYDFILSNPPFSQKLPILERLFSFGVPFAMVMGLPILNYQVVGKFFHTMQEQGKQLQLLIVDKKVSFDGNTASFNNSFFCHDLLPRDIIFHHLENNNSGVNFIGSRMKEDAVNEIQE